MSRLIIIDPQIQQDSEPEGYEFGYYTFDTLPAMEVSNINTVKKTSSEDGNDNVENIVKLPITDKNAVKLTVTRYILLSYHNSDRKRKYQRRTNV